MKSTKLIALLTSIVLFAGFAQESPAQFKLPFGKKAPTARDQIQLDDKAGPWLVMCASFVGESGRQQALRLVEELRQRHKLGAYLYTHRFDFTEQVTSQAKGWEKYVINGKETHRPIRMRTASQSSFEEYAVVVGDFPSVDDSRAQRTLALIKSLRPESMMASDMDEDSWREKLRKWREQTAAKDSTSNEKRGPMKAAFLMPNPKLPEEYFAARKIDQFIVNWNSEFKYTLLRNTGKYSVKVASFFGEGTIEEDEMAQNAAKDNLLKRSRKGITESKLMDGFKKAAVLTAWLRGQGIEAYEFHDRGESYVSVGSFDWLYQTDANGTRRNNPEVMAVISKFQGTAISLPGKQQSGLKTFKLPMKLTQAGITCAAQPKPVLNPKGKAVRTGSRFFGGLRR